MDALYQEVYNDIRIDYVANSRGGRMASVHYHEAYEIYILEKGERTYIIDDTFLRLSARDIALIKPYELHSTDGGIYSRYLLYFKDDYLDRYFTYEAKEKLLSFFKRKKLTMDAEQHKKLKSLLLELKKDEENFMTFTEIMNIFLKAYENSEDEEQSEKNRLISRVVEYMANNYLEIKSLDELAERFFITKHYLCRLFKKETGVSVVTYINTHKIQLACEKLQYTQRNVEEIAAECGFNSSMYFCKIFKNTMGVSPGAYRKIKQY